jgi:hypothetical protein
LAIGGPESWTALALRDGGTVAQTATDAAKNKQKGGKGDPNAPKRKGKGKRPKITSGPKVKMIFYTKSYGSLLAEHGDQNCCSESGWSVE